MSSADVIARDKELVLCAQQEPEAFGAIFDLYYNKMFSYVLRRVGDTAAAEDIVAETFSKALRSIKTFSWRGVPLSAWLYRIAGNEIKLAVRGKHKRHLSLELLYEHGFDAASEEALSEQGMLDQVLAEDALYARVTAALRTLPARYSEAISLRYMENKEIYEIAQIMGKREGSVRSLLSRGLTKLREALAGALQQNGEERITTDEGRSVLSILTRIIP